MRSAELGRATPVRVYDRWGGGVVISDFSKPIEVQYFETLTTVKQNYGITTRLTHSKFIVVDCEHHPEIFTVLNAQLVDCPRPGKLPGGFLICKLSKVDSL